MVKAKAAFQKMNLIPQYPIYDDWLTKVENYVKSQGGQDPYAEGRWLAGSLKKKADSKQKKEKLIQLILESAKAGTKVDDIQIFHDQVIRALN
ncbi:hypothetical protein D3C72_2264160 [compost metagenome]